MANLKVLHVPYVLIGVATVHYLDGAAQVVGDDMREFEVTTPDAEQLEFANKGIEVDERMRDAVVDAVENFLLPKVR